MGHIFNFLKKCHSVFHSTDPFFFWSPGSLMCQMINFYKWAWMRWSLGHILAYLSLQEKSQPVSAAHPFSAWSPLANFWSPVSKIISKIPRSCICLSPNSLFSAKISRWFKKQSQVCGFVCFSPTRGPYKVSSTGFVELTFASDKQNSTDTEKPVHPESPGWSEEKKVNRKMNVFCPKPLSWWTQQWSRWNSKK